MKTRMNFKRPGLLAMMLLFAVSNVLAATNELSGVLAKGLFEEEANHNLGAAIQMYQSVIDRFDADRKLAATAIFRLGECYRKQGSTNEAVLQYQRLLREFPDQTPLLTLSRQNLVTLGVFSTVQSGPVQSGPATNAESSIAMVDLGETSRVEAIIRNSPDLINAPDASGQTLLQTYAGQGNLVVVKLLLDNGAVANGIKHPELTPLHFAAGNGHKSVVDLLLSKGASPDVKTESGVTPLHLAISKGYELVARDLLDSGAPVNTAVEKDVNHTGTSLNYELHASQTPLQIACEQGYHSLVDLLIVKGANVNPPGVVLLLPAVRANDEALLKKLLAAGAEPDAGGAAALKAAAESGNVRMLDLLLARSAGTNLNGVLEAAVNGKRPEAVKHLIQLKADPNAKNADGLPLIFRAIGDPPTLLALLDGGADPNSHPVRGESVLAAAVSGNGVPDQTIEMLLTHSADANLATLSQGLTPLHFAADHGKILAAKLLLKNGAKVDSRTKDGQTPLHFAVLRGQQAVAALLLDNGADPNLRNNAGETPLDIAGRFHFAAPVPAFGQALPGTIPTPTPLRTSGSQPDSLADLLRLHGATEDLPHYDRIEVRRGANFSSTVISHSANDVDEFTLLELLAVHYGFVSDSPEPFAPNTTWQYHSSSRTIVGSLSFPNLDEIEIRRAELGAKRWTNMVVSIRSTLESGDCSRDVRLQWGDQVEIPEADHPLASSWNGFSSQVMSNLFNCLKRQIQLTIKGHSTNLVIEATEPRSSSKWPELPAATFNSTPVQFSLVPILRNSGLLRASSDVSRVKVSRQNALTGESWERTFDCSWGKPAPRLWLRDGDVLEVPDKP